MFLSLYYIICVVVLFQHTRGLTADMTAIREILNAEVEDREAIPYDDEYYTALASQYASTAAKEKKMAPEWSVSQSISLFAFKFIVLMLLISMTYSCCVVVTYIHPSIHTTVPLLYICLY